MDYSRTEKVQFEDDDYYYYVKAVPKMTVAAQTKTVKKINTQSRTASSKTNSSGRNSGALGRSTSASHTVGSGLDYHPSDSAEDSLEDLFEDDDFIINSRNVVTERTVYNRNTDRSGSAFRRNNGQNGVNINNNLTADMDEDNDFDFDYKFEELE